MMKAVSFVSACLRLTLPSWSYFVNLSVVALLSSALPSCALKTKPYAFCSCHGAICLWKIQIMVI
uniref:Uncharacterized protein n=3 Tax=Cercopithecidae TaxID=9527 RepID=A0A8D2E6W6_THEGE|nr:unnamed protein product [Macaca fascicularis]